MRVLLLAASLVATLLNPASVTARERVAYTDTCVLKHGPEYRYTVTLSGVRRTFKGSSWDLTMPGMSSRFPRVFNPLCRLARSSARVLAKQPYTGHDKPVHHGPPGWRCRSDSKLPLPGVTSVTVLYGFCQNRRTTRSFLWQPHENDEVEVTPPRPPQTPAPAGQP